MMKLPFLEEKKTFFKLDCHLTNFISHFTMKRPYKERCRTCRLRHVNEIPGNCRFQGQGQSHDRKCNCSAALRSCSSDESSDDHGQRHDVVGGEVLEVVVLDGQAPPKMIQKSFFSTFR